MSIRQQAEILGIAPSYLSMLLNGKRPWNPAIKERYDELVKSVVTTYSQQITPISEGEKQLSNFGGSARESNPPHQSKDCCQRI